MVRVHAVSPDSIASELGLKEGTELLSVNGRALTDFLDWEFLTADDQFEVEALFPDLANRAQREVEQRWNTMLRSRSIYDPKPDKQTVLAIYLATRKVGVAVFQAPAPVPSDPAPAVR